MKLPAQIAEEGDLICAFVSVEEVEEGRGEVAWPQRRTVFRDSNHKQNDSTKIPADIRIHRTRAWRCKQAVLAREKINRCKHIPTMS